MSAEATKKLQTLHLNEKQLCVDPAPTELHPPIEPYETGFLEVGEVNKHSLYYELSGNPKGKPAIYLHGGPGGGTRPGVRQFFDPEQYKIVLLDQRGAGQSKPNVADDYQGALADNSTSFLVADLESLRKHLGVEKWHVVLGGSWGSTLAIAYAQAHPDSMDNVLLRGIFTFLQDEIDALFRNGSTSANYPEIWEAYRDFIRNHPKLQDTPDIDLLEGYQKLLNDAETRDAAATSFVSYELNISKVHRNQEGIAKTLANPAVLIPFASLEVVYMLANGFLEEGQLIKPENLSRMKNMNVSIVHGRNDHVCLPTAAWRFHNGLLAAGVNTRLWFVDGNGHSDSEPGIGGALKAEADRIGKA